MCIYPVYRYFPGGITGIRSPSVWWYFSRYLPIFHSVSPSAHHNTLTTQHTHLHLYPYRSSCPKKKKKCNKLEFKKSVTDEQKGILWRQRLYRQWQRAGGESSKAKYLRHRRTFCTLTCQIELIKVAEYHATYINFRKLVRYIFIVYSVKLVNIIKNNILIKDENN